MIAQILKIILVKSLLMCHMKFDSAYQDYLCLSQSIVLQLTQRVFIKSTFVAVNLSVFEYFTEIMVKHFIDMYQIYIIINS